MQTVLLRHERLLNEASAQFSRLNELIVESRVMRIHGKRQSVSERFAMIAEMYPHLLLDLSRLRIADEHYIVEEAQFSYNSVKMHDEYLARLGLQVDSAVIDLMQNDGECDNAVIQYFREEQRQIREKEQAIRSEILETADGFTQVRLLIQMKLEHGNNAEACRLLALLRDDYRTMCQELLPQAS